MAQQGAASAADAAQGSHLWEIDHPYYCNEGNFYSNDCGQTYKSFSDFLAEEGDADLDMNLVFRWDWREGSEWGAGDFTGDVNYRNGHLLVFFMGQRKGIYRFARVDVCRADEAAVREFLEPRFAHLLSLWEPLSPTPSSTDQTAGAQGGDPNG